MRKTILWIISVVIILCIFPLCTMIKGSGAYTISNDQFHITVDKSAVLSVEETISMKDCQDLLFHKDIVQDYQYTNTKGEQESYAYGIEHIAVDGADYTTTHENGKVRLNIQLEEPTQDITIRYSIRMRKFDIEDANIFLYHLLSPSNEGTIEQLQATIEFPNTLNTTLNVSVIDQSGIESQSLLHQLNDKTLTIQSTQELNPGQGIQIEGTLRNFYFTYSHPVTMQLYFAIFSILLVLGLYLAVVYSSKFHKKDLVNEFYPIEHLKMGALGYILDGVSDERDILTIIIEWANQNYIQIYDENQTISLVIVNELPPSAPAYEKHLFNLIFTDYTMVTVDQLQTRNLYAKMKEVEKELYYAQASKQEHPVYTNASYVWQLLSALVVCIPMSLTMFACIYEEAYQFMNSLIHALLCGLLVYGNCLPWIWVLKHKVHLSKNTLDVYQILIGLINFVCGFLLYNFYIIHNTPVTYIAITIVLTLLTACVMIFMEKRTFYGRTLQNRLLSLRTFIRRSNTEQLTNLLYDNPYYFEDMLPYAYSFDITDIWGKKFTSIPLQAPFWYFHANASAQSTIYWMNSLEISLDRIIKALYHEEEYIKKQGFLKQKNRKLTQEKKVKEKKQKEKGIPFV